MLKLFAQKVWHSRDFFRLATSLVLLVSAAILQPTIQVKRDIRNYLLVVDISQSMNVEDVTIKGVSSSRLAYTKEMLQNIVANMPCGTGVGIAIFAGTGIAALYTPLEVCENYSVILDTISHLEWRNAWAANSQIRQSLFSLATVLRSFSEPAQVVYFTDGEEAPKLHIFNTKDLSSFQKSSDWLFVGIGSEKGAGIPKFSDQNQLIGYWSNDSFAVQPGISQISQGNLGARDTSVAISENDTYQSKLDEKYLKSLAKEIDGDYVRGDNLVSVLSAMKDQKPAAHIVAPMDVSWVLASLAGLVLISAYLPRRMISINKDSGRKVSKKPILTFEASQLTNYDDL